MFLVNWTMRALMGNLIKLCKFDLIATRWRCDDDDDDYYDYDYDVKQQDLFCEQRCCSVFILNTPKGTWYIKYIYITNISKGNIYNNCNKRSQIQIFQIFPKQIAGWRFCINFPLLQAEYFNKQCNFKSCLFVFNWLKRFWIEFQTRFAQATSQLEEGTKPYLWKSNIWATWKKKKMNIEISKRGRNWVFSNVNHMEFVLCWGGRVLRSVAVSWCVNRLSGNISDTAYL